MFLKPSDEFSLLYLWKLKPWVVVSSSFSDVAITELLLQRHVWHLWHLCKPRYSGQIYCYKWTHNLVERSVNVDVLGVVLFSRFFLPIICYPVKWVWHIDGLKCSVFLIVKSCYCIVIWRKNINFSTGLLMLIWTHFLNLFFFCPICINIDKICTESWIYWG